MKRCRPKATKSKDASLHPSTPNLILSLKELGQVLKNMPYILNLPDELIVQILAHVGYAIEEAIDYQPPRRYDNLQRMLKRLNSRPVQAARQGLHGVTLTCRRLSHLASTSLFRTIIVDSHFTLDLLVRTYAEAPHRRLVRSLAFAFLPDSPYPTPPQDELPQFLSRIYERFETCNPSASLSEKRIWRRCTDSSEPLGTSSRHCFCQGHECRQEPPPEVVGSIRASPCGLVRWSFPRLRKKHTSYSQLTSSLAALLMFLSPKLSKLQIWGHRQLWYLEYVIHRAVHDKDMLPVLSSLSSIRFLTTSTLSEIMFSGENILRPSLLGTVLYLTRASGSMIEYIEAPLINFGHSFCHQHPPIWKMDHVFDRLQCLRSLFSQQPTLLCQLLESCSRLESLSINYPYTTGPATGDLEGSPRLNDVLAAKRSTLRRLSLNVGASFHRLMPREQCLTCIPALSNLVFLSVPLFVLVGQPSALGTRDIQEALPPSLEYLELAEKWRTRFWESDDHSPTGGVRSTYGTALYRTLYALVHSPIHLPRLRKVVFQEMWSFWREEGWKLKDYGELNYTVHQFGTDSVETCGEKMDSQVELSVMYDPSSPGDVLQPRTRHINAFGYDTLDGA